MQNLDTYTGRVGFAVGTGRCGTHFLARAAGLEPHVAASHERNPYNETFHRYCQWYGLPVDGEGFLHQMEAEIREDLAYKEYSFEASAYLSLSIRELYERFGAKFVLMVRAPERVVNSFHYKGWYAAPAIRQDVTLAPGYQECESFHHVLARPMPSGEEFTRWLALTRVGKLAWYWNAMNARILDQFAALPETHRRIEKIETLDYDCYQEMAAFLGYSVDASREDFEALRQRRPNAFSGVPTPADWSEQEAREFEAYVAPMAQRLGYEYRTAHLPVPTLPISALQEKETGMFGWLKEALARRQG